MNKASLLLSALVCLQTGFAANIAVPAGGNLQAALNAAQPGDTITLAAGATYVGNFNLAPNAGPQWITIQSSAMNVLPAAGNRVSSTQSAAMPKLLTPNANAALSVLTGANYYRMVGIEFLPAAGVYVQDLIRVGAGVETSIAQLPHDIEFDRDYIHGDPVAGGKRGIALNGGQTLVHNCYITAFTSTWQDTQALAGWNGPGPFQIVNNLLEAGTENVGFGGTVPGIPNLIPSDILIQRNYIHKLLSWKKGDPSYAGVPVWAKNFLELKNAQRVTVDSNIFENNWIGADQPGLGLVFTVRTVSDAMPWAVVNDVKITNNIIRHSAGGVDFAGHDDDGTGSAGQFVLSNNLWEDINSSWGGDGHLFVILDGVNGLSIDHNTSFQTGVAMGFDVGPSYNVNFTNNISEIGWGVTGGGAGVGTSALNAYDIGGIFTHNVLIDGSSSQYPSGNFFPSSDLLVGFVGFQAGNYALAATSPFKGAGTDSKDLGADINALNTLTATVVSGQQ
jgi:hypothetical protein